MADVINHMYFNYFYNVREGYSRTLSLYKWHVSLHFYLTYHSVFPNPSLPPVMVVEGEGEAAWARCLSCTSFCRLASLSALSLAICCRTASLWAHSLALSSLIWFTIFCACLSPLGPFWLNQVLVPDDVYQILPSWFPKMQRILSIISSLVKIINWCFAESKWQYRVSGLFTFHELTKNWAQS